MAVEQTVVALATVACTSWAVRLIRAGARRADADAGALSRRMAAQDAALAAEEIKSRAATTVHDDVLSVLRAISVAGRPLPWSLVVAKAKGAQDALARQGSGGTKGPADLGSALRRAGESAAELDVRYDIDGDIDVPRSAVEALSAAAGEALRNVAAHAGVSSALVTARGRPVRRGHSSRLRRRDGLRSGPGRTGEHRPAQQRHLSQVQMTRQVGVGLAAANMILAAVGSLAVAPGTTDAFAYWIAGDSGIVIAAVYFILGPAFGLTALAVDLAALTAGLLATGHGIAAGGSVSMLTSPVIGAGLAAAMLAAFRSLSSHTESQLAQYRERLRLRARADAISRVDRTALENARRVAGPVLSAVICSPARDPDLQTAAALANATLRDELLAPGFLTAALAERVHAARAAGASITVKFARQSDTALAETARELLAAGLADWTPTMTSPSRCTRRRRDIRRC